MVRPEPERRLLARGRSRSFDRYPPDANCRAGDGARTELVTGRVARAFWTVVGGTGPALWPLGKLGKPRLALVHELPDSIQERVRRGEMGAHGAAKYLVPLARANRQVCLELVEAIGATRLGSRDLRILYTAYQTGNWVTRQRLLEAPLIFLKSYKEAEAPPAVEPGPSDSLLTDLEILGSTARRARRRLRLGVLRNLPEKDRQDLAGLLDQSRREIERLAQHFHQEMGHAGPEYPSGDSEAARAEP